MITAFTLDYKSRRWFVEKHSAGRWHITDEFRIQNLPGSHKTRKAAREYIRSLGSVEIAPRTAAEAMARSGKPFLVDA